MLKLNKDYINHCIDLAKDMIKLSNELIIDLEGNDISKIIQAANNIESLNIIFDALKRIRVMYTKQGAGVGLYEISLPGAEKLTPQEIFDNHYVFESETTGEPDENATVGDLKSVINKLFRAIGSNL